MSRLRPARPPPAGDVHLLWCLERDWEDERVGHEATIAPSRPVATALRRRPAKRTAEQHMPKERSFACEGTPRDRSAAEPAECHLCGYGRARGHLDRRAHERR